MSFPIDNRSAALNIVTVAGVNSPGRATITGLSVPFVWDVQTGYGLSGAITIFRGRGIAKFTLTITMWDEPDQWIQWPLFKKVLEPPTKLKPLVVDMLHPLLSSAGVKQVSVESIGEPERQSNGLWIATIKCLEYRPPLPALVKPKGSVPGVPGAPIPPKTQADIFLAKQEALVAADRLHP